MDKRGWTGVNVFGYKNGLAEATMPAFPEPDGRVYLVTDASDTTVEAAITQIAGQDLNLLFFFSQPSYQKLNSIESYSLCTVKSYIFAICWKDAILEFNKIINPTEGRLGCRMPAKILRFYILVLYRYLSHRRFG